MALRCIITATLQPSQLRDEIAYVARYFSEAGETNCKTLFGFAWGNDYYPNDWIQEETLLNELQARIQTVESAGLGSIGSDDLYVSVSGVEFQFCHDSDIHLSFDSPNIVATHFHERWKALGYRPAEWSKGPKTRPQKKSGEADA